MLIIDLRLIQLGGSARKKHRFGNPKAKKIVQVLTAECTSLFILHVLEIQVENKLH